MTVYFARLKTGHPNPPADRPDDPGCWRIFTICSARNVKASLARKDVFELHDDADRKDARATLVALENRANTGQPLSVLYDEKQCHEALTFYSEELGSDVKLFRIWGVGAIRVYFCYLPDKRILILKIMSKRTNKLSKGQEKELRDIAENVFKCLSDYDFDERLICTN